MHPLTFQVTIGGLIHDIGKLVYRAGGQRNHSALGYETLKRLWSQPQWQPVLDCVRWHHAKLLRDAAPEPGNPAYIVCAADNLSAGADRRENDRGTGGFRRDQPLAPVFSHLNGSRTGWSLPPYPQDGTLRLPVQGEPGIPVQRYQDLLRELEQGLRDIPMDEAWLGSLLSLLECWTGTVPSSTDAGQSPDISLFDHLKTTAAIGAAISTYLLDRQVEDYRTTLLEREQEFRELPAFLLYSADFSGIQKFIYTVSTANALKSLRSRSFFLELPMEHYIDELLTACGLSRANLLYSGGGHCYLLLANTDFTKAQLTRVNEIFNQWLLDSFGTRLFLTHGWTECSGNDLINQPAEELPYKAMFRRVSSAVAKHKLRRYSPGQIMALNRRREQDDGRECSVCGRSDQMTEQQLCTWCSLFVTLSAKIQRQSVFYVSPEPGAAYDFSLPGADGTVYFLITDENTARKKLGRGDAVSRIYTKNRDCTGLRYSTRLYVGDYCYSNEMDTLAQASSGIPRIAVCRMDVDNLGAAFVSGFEQPEAAGVQRYRYVTISRTAAFSRQMSLFFKCYINPLLDRPKEDGEKLAVSIVYSGGDDVFLVGAWNDVLEAAQRIQRNLADFTCGALTISGGVALYDSHYPIRLAADETAELEERAKRQPGKNAIALFAPRENHTYGWEIFSRRVMGEKKKALEDFFSASEQERGNGFLYRLLELLRQAQGEQINLARYAYMLARMEPRDRKQKAVYERFSANMYRWALSPEDRLELITAIYIYVYQERKGR